MSCSYASRSSIFLRHLHFYDDADIKDKIYNYSLNSGIVHSYRFNFAYSSPNLRILRNRLELQFAVGLLQRFQLALLYLLSRLWVALYRSGTTRAWFLLPLHACTARHAIMRSGNELCSCEPKPLLTITYSCFFQQKFLLLSHWKVGNRVG